MFGYFQRMLLRSKKMYFLIVVLAIILICAFMETKKGGDFLGLVIALCGVVLLLGLVAEWWKL
jgi:hypothetical protein